MVNAALQLSLGGHRGGSARDVRGPSVVICLAAALFIGHASLRVTPPADRDAGISVLSPEIADAPAVELADPPPDIALPAEASG